MNKKRLIMLGMAVLMAGSMITGTAAVAMEVNEPQGIIVPFAETRGYKYKTLNGLKFKRLWSYTYGYWVDEEWTVA